MVSLDFEKAFDRIEFGPLFDALRQQGVPECYIALLTALYNDQWGSVNGSTYFEIQRGVKQGDVISPMLFNAGLEMAFRSWKVRLANHGLLLSGNAERLSNSRYADDVLLYGKSLHEVQEMLGWLTEDLQRIGIQLNSNKTKIFTTEANHPDFIHIHDDLVQILAPNETH